METVIKGNIQCDILANHMNVLNVQMSLTNGELPNGDHYVMLPYLLKAAGIIPEEERAEVIFDGRYSLYNILIPIRAGIDVFGDSTSKEHELIENVGKVFAEQEFTSYVIIYAILDESLYSYENYLKLVAKYVPLFKLNKSKLLFVYEGIQPVFEKDPEIL